MSENPNQAQRPRVEPEIIPPERSRRETGWRRADWPPDSSTMESRTHRIYVGRVGPLGIALIMLIVSVLAALILIAVVGAVLLWLPVIALVVAAGALLRYLRR